MMPSSWIEQKRHVVAGFVSSLLVASSVAEGSSAPAECGLSCALPPAKDYYGLKMCLNEAFPPDDNVRLGFNKLPKVTYPDDQMYSLARRSPYGFQQPAVVVMAESEDEVVAAVKCATAANYKISPRGRNHHYQGLSNMDGYVVVDCSLLCDPDTFEVTRMEEDWILPRQKIIATIKGGSGCTNAVMLAASFKIFDAEDGALYAIGTCPSVGITGYTTGGGSGDITPYVGWGADDILEARIVLADGSVVTASETENSDLFWATQGGGSGFGVITSLTTVVPQAPEPPEGETSRKYCFALVRYSTPDDDSRRNFLIAFQDFLYEADPVVNSKFGGNGGLHGDTKFLTGIYLGSATEFLESFRANGLLDNVDSTYNSMLMMDYKVLCDGTAPCNALHRLDDMPSKGIQRLAEFNTYQEAMLYKLCTQITTAEEFFAGAGSTYTMTSGDWCADLDISSEFCTVAMTFADILLDVNACVASWGFSSEQCENIVNNNIQGLYTTREKCVVEYGIPDEACAELMSALYSEPHCHKPEVIAAFAEAAYDPLSFMNTAGPPDWFFPFWEMGGMLPGGSLDNFATSNGGLLVPKVDIDTLMDLDELGLNINHFQHGAPMQKRSTDTAFPWRDAGIMLGASQDANYMKSIMARMAEFYGDEKKLQGYYNYMNPMGNPNWRYYYFGENYERLANIKLKYDALNSFGNPMQVEPAFHQSDQSVPEQLPMTLRGDSSSVTMLTCTGTYLAALASALVAGFALF